MLSWFLNIKVEYYHTIIKFLKNIFLLSNIDVMINNYLGTCQWNKTIKNLDKIQARFLFRLFYFTNYKLLICIQIKVLWNNIIILSE